jgi:hypothetical protein
VLYLNRHSRLRPRNWLKLQPQQTQILILNFQLMPVLTAAACNPSLDCPLVEFPQSSALCVCELSVGGINDLYFIPCTETLSEANILDVAWWQGLISAESIGRIGVGLGSIAKKSDKKERVGSCRTEQLVQTTWALTYVIKCFDKTSSRITTEQVNTLVTKFNNFLLVARMCDGSDTILPVGTFTTSDFNWTVPDNAEEFQNVSFELSWLELGLPRTYDVAGLSAVLPKAA